MARITLPGGLTGAGAWTEVDSASKLYQAAGGSHVQVAFSAAAPLATDHGFTLDSGVAVGRDGRTEKLWARSTSTSPAQLTY